MLKRPILLLIICILVSGIWVGGVRKFQAAAFHAMNAVQVSRGEMESKLRQLEDELRAIRSHMDRYRQLQASGVIGDEGRLELVEALGRIRARYNLYALQFDIGQQAVLPLPDNPGQGWPGVADGGDDAESTEEEGAGPLLSLHYSRIVISLPLLHEEDLTRLLEELQGLGRGLFVVEECEVVRLESGVATGESLRAKENLSAACKILWLTMKSEDRKPGEKEAEDGLERPPGAEI
ncbi:MAG TPA: hypothetical protein ENN94_01490 [Geoalkalibacter subterraneus]|uniref:Uncharacterized protein n=1 Tax=Geoalkalibacter subterraneus TaxID=483547 RepID=A0A831PNL3_9BACT|nr:hypothetical protein [Geoalkalibacter subterraneus]